MLTLAMITAAAVAAAPVPVGNEIKFVRNPDWILQPTPEQMQAAYPRDALSQGIGGRAVMSCLLTLQGRLDDCAVVSEEPAGAGFGAAALSLAPKMVMKPGQTQNGPVSSRVSIPFSFDGIAPQPDQSAIVPLFPTSNVRLVRSPDWVRKPTFDEIQAAYPKQAYIKGVSGRAILGCVVNLRGGLEDCQVEFEEPAGMEFGAAAQALIPRIVMTPGEDSNGPVKAPVRIPISFKTEGGLYLGGLNLVRMISDPEFLSAPTFADVRAVHPPSADGQEGRTVIRCKVKTTGLLSSCQGFDSNAARKGFADAAKRLSGKFRLKLDPALIAAKAPLAVDIPIRFPSLTSVDLTGDQISQPQWLIGPDPSQVAKLFPARAIERDLTTGRGVAVCTVGAEGRLTECVPGKGDPDGWGFSESAVQVASVMKMNLWSQDGGPVIGARFQLPIRFNLAAPAAGAIAPTPSK